MPSSLLPALASILSLSVWTLACAPTSGSGDSQGHREPNVILISIDTLRADHLGCYGYPRRTSPNLDRFAEDDAVLFETVINTGGGTLPVHMSMFTSLPPLVHNVLPDNGKALAPERVTLAEQLQAAGYLTAGFTGAGFMVAKFGFDQGFDLFDDSGGDFVKIMPKAFHWLEENRAKTFFLFLHTYDVHSDWKQLPYDAPNGFNDLFTSSYKGSFTGCMFGECASKLLVLLDQKIQHGGLDPKTVLSPADLDYMRGLYDGGIAYVDSELGRLFAELKRLGLYDNSLIIVTSDHGEEFLEHRLFLHHQNYEEVARVPWLMKLPGRKLGGQRVRELVSTLEVMPTILDVVGIEPNPEVLGRSTLPLVAGRRKGRQWVFMAGGLEKIRTPTWSALFSHNRPVQLFDLQADPDEQVNLLRTHPEIAHELLGRYKDVRSAELAYRRRLAATQGTVRLSQEEIQRLQSLGYLN